MAPWSSGIVLVCFGLLFVRRNGLRFGPADRAAPSPPGALCLGPAQRKIGPSHADPAGRWHRGSRRQRWPRPCSGCRRSGVEGPTALGFGPGSDFAMADGDSRRILLVVLAAALMAVVGFVDDLWPLPPPATAGPATDRHGARGVGSARWSARAAGAPVGGGAGPARGRRGLVHQSHEFHGWHGLADRHRGRAFDGGAVALLVSWLPVAARRTSGTRPPGRASWVSHPTTGPSRGSSSAMSEACRSAFS